MALLTPYFEKQRALYESVKKQGFADTYLKGVKFFWGEEVVDCGSMVYPSGIVIIGQGRKVGYFDGRCFTYDKDNFLIVSVSTPFECSTYGSKEEPLLGVFIEIDLGDLNEIAASMQEVGERSFIQAENAVGVLPMPISDAMHKAIERLMMCLTSPSESRVLGRSLVREIIYRVLQSDHGAALYSLTNENTASTRVAKVVDYIRQNYSSKITVKTLANYANMSETTFYRAFKSMTGHSPLQYVKKVRLSRARSLIVHDGVKASAAAFAVGYDSASQFSREFKQFFQVTPAKAKGAGYADIDIWQQ